MATVLVIGKAQQRGRSSDWPPRHGLEPSRGYSCDWTLPRARTVSRIEYTTDSPTVTVRGQADKNLEVALDSDTSSYSPGAQKHLIHISSTKGLTPGMGRTVLRNPQKAFLKFRKCGLPLEGATRSTPKIRFNSHLEYIHQTCAKMFSLGV